MEGAITGAIGAATGGASLAATAGKQAVKLTGKQIVKQVAKTAAAAGVSGGIGNAAGQLVATGKVNVKKAATSAVIASASGGIGAVIPVTKAGQKVIKAAENVKAKATQAVKAITSSIEPKVQLDAGFGRISISSKELAESTTNIKQANMEISEAAHDTAGDGLSNVVESTTEANSTVVDEYGILKNNKSIPGQAHHLNQNAAYRDIIPSEKGMSVKLEGNAFTQPGTPHYDAHTSLESFWDQFRRGGEREGEMPTNLEYSKGLLNSLRNAGYSTEEAFGLTRQAIKQRVEYGLYGGMPVPRIPGKIDQIK